MENDYNNQTGEDTAKPDGGRGFSAGVYEWAESLVFAIVVVVLIFSFIFRVVTVNGESMLPNYHQDDRLIVSAVAPEIEQGDVVVVVDILDDPIIKRVVATQGQTVDIHDGSVYVDGVRFDDEGYNVERGITTPGITSLSPLEFPQVVPEGCVFVLGDNRSVSRDSRYTDVGMVDERKILGKALLNIYPFDKFGLSK